MYKRQELLIHQGYLDFEDAYSLAREYLLKIPPIKGLLQKRFKYVFVDEMQDMDTHQYELLESLFYSNENNFPIYQRIGDKNQAIFGGDAKIQEVWTDRENVLPLNGSHRLTKPIADVVNCFALKRTKDFCVKGLRAGSIKPHIIVFDDNKIEALSLIHI